jgi:hypothetical protein
MGLGIFRTSGLGRFTVIQAEGNPRNSTRTEYIIRLGTHFRERRVCARSSNPLNSGLGPTKNSMAR